VTKILIVEDDKATAGLLKTVFEMEGFKTIVCPNPKLIMGTIRGERPDLVFMDYHLAESESLPILQEIKADDELKKLPVVMTSGLDRSLECSQAGAESFIIKPFRPASLIAEIRRVLGE
jgi:DNA-binding response OmpR family regulator